MWQRFYLVRVWKQSKVLFTFILIFAFLQLFFNLKREQNFPFIVWDMYSRHQEVPEVSSLYVFYLDGKPYNSTQLPIWKEETSLKSFSLYHSLKMNYDHDPMDELVKHRCIWFPGFVYQYTAKQIENHPEDYANYPDWLFNYLRKATQTYFKKLEVKELNFDYKDKKYVPAGPEYTLLTVEHD